MAGSMVDDAIEWLQCVGCDESLLYAIAVGTVARGWGSIDGDYLFHVVVGYEESCAPFREGEKHGYVSQV